MSLATPTQAINIKSAVLTGILQRWECQRKLKLLVTKHGILQNMWEGIKSNSADSMLKKADEENFLRFVKNVYRVLLTRGMKGCYVYFMDKSTEEFFRSRISS